jgi:excisionase family DNA binding protein
MSQMQHLPTLHDFLTVGEAAQVLGVCAATLRQWDRTGKLKSIRHPINQYRLYRKADLEALLQQFLPAKQSALPQEQQ